MFPQFRPRLPAPLPDRAPIQGAVHDSPSAQNWIAHYQENLRSARENEATPRIAQTAAEAIRDYHPFDQARLLLLIQTMRKEDFPVVLDVLRKGKNNFGGIL